MPTLSKPLSETGSNVRAGAGSHFTDVIHGDAENVSGSTLTVHVPANGSALYVMP